MENHGVNKMRNREGLQVLEINGHPDKVALNRVTVRTSYNILAPIAIRSRRTESSLSAEENSITDVRLMTLDNARLSEGRKSREIVI